MAYKKPEVVAKSEAKQSFVGGCPEKKMADSDSLIEQFRNELLNREETYNGYFDRKPKVGYVNPIKDKNKRIIKKVSQNMTSTMPLIKK